MSARSGAAQPGRNAADGRERRRARRHQSRNDHPHGGSESGSRPPWPNYPRDGPAQSGIRQAENRPRERSRAEAAPEPAFATK